MKKVVVLTGAGISAESGISTFRDSNGLWENHQIEDVASPKGWATNPSLVNDFYNRRRRQVLTAQPNQAHLLLRQLEDQYDVCIITQNIDNLHERAGSSNIIHLHGEILKMRCTHDEYDIQPIDEDIILGKHLSKKGFQMRPHIVWFGEDVPMMGVASMVTAQADIFIVIGTSLQVYPAASLLQYTPAHIPIYIIDKHIPPYRHLPNVTTIEMTASEGMKKLLAEYL